MRLSKKAKKAYQEGGASLVLCRMIRKLYRSTIRPLFPYKIGEYNGVKVPAYRLLDPFFEKNLELVDPEYEAGLMKSMEENIEPGDKVTILGGGNGVTTVKAAKLNKEPNKVTVYEASDRQMDKIKKTLQLNGCTGVDIKQAIVGPVNSIWGDYSGSDRVPPSELDPCDVLEMDIEGSEIEVIENMDIEPEIIIVETHGFLDSPTEEVKEKLEEKGYDIVNTELAKEEHPYKEKDVRVVTAAKS